MTENSTIQLPAVVRSTNGALEKLKTLLTTLFQLDAPELDFGIYRILNYRREEIRGFIERELESAVEGEFSKFLAEDTAQLQRELGEKREEIRQIEKQMGESIIENDSIRTDFQDKPFAIEYL